MTIETFIGIDPGMSGAIAHYSDKKGAKVVKMPKKPAEMLQYFAYLKEICANPVVFVEKVQAFTSDSSDNNPGKQHRIQVMLNNYNTLLVCIIQAGFSYIEVPPATWQKYLNLRKEGEEKPERKARYKAAANQYYPEIKTTLWNADALCVLQFGRLKYQYDINWIIQKLKVNPQQKLL